MNNKEKLLEVKNLRVEFGKGNKKFVAVNDDKVERSKRTVFSEKTYEVTGYNLSDDVVARIGNNTYTSISSAVENLTEEEYAYGLAYCSNLTIYGEAGSFIEGVANELGIPFVAE